MQINFYPEQNNPKFEKAVEEYSELWQKEGKKITETIEKVSGLKFKEKVINALIYNEISYSLPLQLQAGLSIEHERGIITHELCHRLIVGNDAKFKKLPKDPFKWNIEVHKPVMLILYDVWTMLYGEDFAEKEVAYEISLWTHGEISPYKVVWDWALAMTKAERKKEFRKYFQE